MNETISRTGTGSRWALLPSLSSTSMKPSSISNPSDHFSRGNSAIGKYFANPEHPRHTLYVQKALPLMRDGGSIIMNGSIAHLKGMPGLSVYAGSKAALRSFARSWAVELAERRMRVNVLSPGPLRYQRSHESSCRGEGVLPVKNSSQGTETPGRNCNGGSISRLQRLQLRERSEICVDGGISQI